MDLVEERVGLGAVLHDGSLNMTDIRCSVDLLCDLQDLPRRLLAEYSPIDRSG